MNKIKLLIIALCLTLPIPAVATGDWFTMAAGSGDSATCMESGFTNSIVYSRDIPSGITSGNWTVTGTPVVTYDAVGLAGLPNTAITLTDDNGSGIEDIRQTVVSGAATGQYVAQVVYIKKDSDETRFPSFYLYISAGAHQSIHLNTKTGVTAIEVTSGTASHEVVSSGDWWILYSSVLSDSNANVLSIVAPSRGSVLGSASSAATGSIIVGNVELYKNKIIADVSSTCPVYTP